MTNNKRSVFDYIMWLVYLCMTGGLCYFYGTNLLVEYRESVSFFDKFYIVAVFLVILIVGLLFEITANRLARSSSRGWLTVFGIFEFILGIAAVIGYRAVNFTAIVAELDKAQLVGRYYSDAQINAVGGLYFNIYSVEGIYETIVSFFFMFFGNSAFALYLAETSMLLLATIFMFIALRLLLGHLPAFIYLVVVAFLPEFVIHGEKYSVYICEYMIFATGLLLIACVFHAMGVRVLDYIMLILIALVLGPMYVYTEITLPLFVLVLALIITDARTEEVNKPVGIFLSLLFFILTVVLSICFDDVWAGRYNQIPSDFSLFITNRFSPILDYGHYALLGEISCLLIVLLLALVYVIFFFVGNDNRASAMILALFTDVILFAFVDAKDNLAVVLVMITLFVAIGADGIKRAALLTNAGAAKGEEVVDEIVIEDLAIEELVEEQVEEAVSSPGAEAEREVSAGATAEAENVELFESPIPLPKKVAKRDVEYDYDVPEELMHYDYDVYGED